MQFSVLMSVYKGEKIDNFKASMDSVLNQTLKANEIILIRDGVVYPELQNIIDVYVENHPTISYYPFDENKGLGEALKFGVQNARNSLILRMDTDDIAVEDRFEKQVSFFESHPEVDVCGGQILEFVDDYHKPISKRSVPLRHEEIVKFIKKRNPFNHMTVAFKRESVLNAGNYRDLFYLEDYYLWCRMLNNGAIFANIDDVLVNARVGEDMYMRRGGYKYFKSWKKLEKYKLSVGITNVFNYLATLTSRFVLQVLMPNSLRGWVFKKFARDGKK